MSVVVHREAAPSGLWSRMSLGQKQVVWAWGFLAVPLVFYVVIRFWPTFQAFYLSVTDWTILKPASFVGIENYKRLLARPALLAGVPQHLHLPDPRHADQPADLVRHRLLPRSGAVHAFGSSARCISSLS